MEPSEKIKTLFVESKVTVSSKFDDNVLADTLAAQAKIKIVSSAASTIGIWNKILDSSITKIAAAWIVICAFYTKYWFIHLIWQQYMQ